MMMTVSKRKILLKYNLYFDINATLNEIFEQSAMNSVILTKTLSQLRIRAQKSVADK